jgi:hypothetical protein
MVEQGPETRFFRRKNGPEQRATHRPLATSKTAVNRNSEPWCLALKTCYAVHSLIE